MYVFTAAFIVPTTSSFAWHDDWVFARSAEILLHERRLHILDATAPNAVFEAVWGALFGSVFGMSLGTLRVSSVALVCCSIPAAYALALDLQHSRAVAALATAAYAFNPLFYVLGFSFMTDAHFVALEMIAMWIYFRALKRSADTRLLLLGSIAASIAILARQQGIFLPASAVGFLLIRRTLGFDARSLRIVAATTAIPLFTAGLHAIWLRRVNGLPSAQAYFVDGLLAAGPNGLLNLLRNVAPIAAIMSGFFLLPLALGVAAATPLIARRLSARGAVAAAGIVALAAKLLMDAWPLPRMPAATSWFARNELGPGSLVTPREDIFGEGIAVTLTAFCGIAFVAVMLGLLRNRARDSDQRKGDELFFALVFFSMVGGVLLGSVQFAPAGLDRYYLPLLPPAYALAILAVPFERRRVVVGVAAVVVLGLGAFGVAGTRDSVMFQAAVWRLGVHATDELRIPFEKLDGGPGWDGYHMGHTAVPLNSPEFGDTATENPPWWIVLFAPAIDSTYVITSSAIPGWEVVATTHAASWLHRHDDETLRLLRRPST